ncbi:hypothetical protein CR513_60969, partial [Mucuna pruriens]
MEIIFLLLDLAMSNFNPLYPYTMFFMFRNWLTTLSLYIGIYKIGIELTTGRTVEITKEQGGLYYLQHTKIVNRNPQKLGQLLNFGFTINVLDIHCLDYLKQCFYIYLQKSLLSPLSVIFVSFQSTIVQHFLLVIIKILNLFTLFILMCGVQLITQYRGLSDLYSLLIIFLMKHKYNVCQIFVDFFHLVKNQFDKSIKRLQSDNDIEFVNLEFSKFLKDNGVVHELTCVNTPQQNGNS